jgi:hypothetical protein
VTTRSKVRRLLLMISYVIYIVRRLNVTNSRAFAFLRIHVPSRFFEGTVSYASPFSTSIKQNSSKLFPNNYNHSHINHSNAHPPPNPLSNRQSPPRPTHSLHLQPCYYYAASPVLYSMEGTPGQRSLHSRSKSPRPEESSCIQAPPGPSPTLSIGQMSCHFVNHTS